MRIDMDRGLFFLVRLMRESWVFMGSADTDAKNRRKAQENDQDESCYLSDGTNDF